MKNLLDENKSGIEKMEKITDYIQSGVGFVTKRYGRNYAEGLANYLTGNGALLASTGDFLDKINKGTVAGDDVADVLQDTASIISGIGVVAGYANPWTLGVLGAVGLARTAFEYYEDNNYDFTQTKNSLFDDASNFLDNLGNLFSNDTPPLFMDNKATIPSIYFNPYISPTIYDPLVLDLDGDGVETLSLKDGVYFDHNGDGVKFKSSWVNKDDGLLVIDKNSNGIIDNGNELFGNLSKLNSSNHLAINGFHSLKEYDTNNDDIIDINDEEFLNLKVWQDKNSDGISQSDELKTLDELGIKYLNIEFSNETKNIDKDNTLDFSSTYTKHKEKLNLTDE